MCVCVSCKILYKTVLHSLKLADALHAGLLYMQYINGSTSCLSLATHACYDDTVTYHCQICSLKPCLVSWDGVSLQYLAHKIQQLWIKQCGLS